MRILGLTGSIGMGKSTAAAMFRDAGVPVHDADAAVHRLYTGAAAAPLEAEFPGVTTAGVVDRAKLAERILRDPDALTRVEAIVHPLVRESEAEFLARRRAEGHPLVLLDVPLLFETGGSERFDAIVVVTADPQIQRKRVLGRPGMTEGKFESLLARQTPDPEKRRRAHFVIDTSRERSATRRRIGAILRALAFAG